MPHWKSILPLSILILLVACTDKGAIRIKGNIRGINQADFFIYSPDGGMNRLDTIHVVEGKFDWQTSLTEEATFVIVYPNFSEQVVFAQPGDVITLKGDGGQLRQVEITGSPDNEELTRFRLSQLDAKESERTAAMEAYINENPDSRTGIYLQRQLTMQTAAASRMRKGEIIPSLQLPPDNLSDEDTDTLFLLTKGKKESPLTENRPLIFIFWATWNGQSHSFNNKARQIINQTRDSTLNHRFQAIDISLDIDLRSYDAFLKRDTVDWPRRCYRQSWTTPIVMKFAITNIPFAIVTDAKRRIIALGSDWERDIQPEIDRFLNIHP